jgi:Domain of unknown function (DUF1844)
MNDPKTPDGGGGEIAEGSRDDMYQAMFANMVIQQANMAMVLLGKVAHPETGEFVQDIETARMFIDQLEMLETKTRGNLSKQEDGLLKQALGSLRMAFVEAVDAPAKPASPRPTAPDAGPAAAPGSEPDQPKQAAPPTDAAASPSDESRKKFSKKY